MAELTELRFDVDRFEIDVLDGVSKSRGIARNQLCIKIVKEWCRDRHSEAMMIQRLTRVEGIDGESSVNSRERVR